MKSSLFELCGETLQAARAAEAGGADRMELCSNLRVGGVTPDLELVKAVTSTVRIPIHVLVRPRDGDFVYSQPEFDTMVTQIRAARKAGARGVVLGILTAARSVDVERSRALVEIARPMSVTFNRAFDETADLSAALEDVIRTGADYLLSSGGAPDVHSGAVRLKALLRQAGDRIRIIAGGGLRRELLKDLVRDHGITWVHGSLLPKSAHGAALRSPETLEASVRQVVELLRGTSTDLELQPLGAR